MVCFLCLSRGCRIPLTNSSYTVTCTLVGFRLALWWIQVASHTWISSLCYSRAWWSMCVTSQHCKPWVGKSHKGGKSDCHPQPEVQWVCTGSSRGSSDSLLFLFLAISVFAITIGLIVMRSATLLHTSDAC